MIASQDGLFAGLFALGAVAAEVSDGAFLQAMLDVEVALVRALSGAGLAPASAAEDVAAVGDARDFDLGKLGRSTGEKGTPVPGLVAALRRRVPEAEDQHLAGDAAKQCDQHRQWIAAAPAARQGQGQRRHRGQRERVGYATPHGQQHKRDQRRRAEPAADQRRRADRGDQAVPQDPPMGRPTAPVTASRP